MAQLAEAIGLSKSAISQWKRTGQVSLASLVAVAGELDLSVDWLLGRTEAGGPGDAARPAAPPVQPIRAPSAGNPPELCRIPADCDLPARLEAMEDRLANMETLLISLLAEERARHTQADAVTQEEKAG